jgi:hypothetical protein
MDVDELAERLLVAGSGPVYQDRLHLRILPSATAAPSFGRHQF